MANLSKFSSHIITSDKVYKLTAEKKDSQRAFNRGLMDFHIVGENLIDDSDNFSTLLGIGRELFDDYPSFRIPIDLEWILIRFLSRYVQTNCIKKLSGPDGEILKTTIFKKYLGKDISDDEAIEILRILFRSWVRVLPQQDVTFDVIFVSTDMTLKTIKQALNTLIFLGQIEEIKPDSYKVKPTIFQGSDSLDKSDPMEDKIIRKDTEIKMNKKRQSVAWDAFISHASEDKTEFVRPLAGALINRGLKIWYDEFTLKIGDSLRRSIDHGLANSQYGIVVISPNFLAKDWPQKELDGLVAREIGREKVILPVWHNINAETVLKYSPMLADRVATNSNLGLERVVDDLIEAMRLDAL